MNGDCSTPLSLQTLLAYRDGELAEAEAEAVELHYLGCAQCAAELELLERLESALANLVASGQLSSSAAASLVERAQQLGVQVRQYTLQPGTSVACTAAPDDDFIAVRLGVDARRGERLDLEAQITFLDSGQHRIETTADVAFDAAHGQVVLLYSGAQIREYPRTRWELKLRLTGPDGERRAGPYTLNHTPWELLPTP